MADQSVTLVITVGRNRWSARRLRNTVQVLCMCKSRECHPEGALATEGSASGVPHRMRQNLGVYRVVRVLPPLCFRLVGRFFGRRPTLRVGARSLRMTR